MENSFILLLLFLIGIQLTKQQNNSNIPDLSNSCDISCENCSQDRISTCTRCNSKYFYFFEKYQCLEKCPEFTKEDNDSKQCKSCASQYCLDCNETTCSKCQPNFIKEKSICISDCREQGKVLDENGKCNDSCSDENSYIVENESQTCIPIQQCPSLNQVPQLKNQSQIIASLLDSIRYALGTVVVYNYPDLSEQYSFQLQNLYYYSSLTDCNFIDDNNLEQGIIHCLVRAPIMVCKFSYIDFDKQSLELQMYRNFWKSGDSGRFWMLIVDYDFSFDVTISLFNYYENKQNKTIDCLNDRLIFPKMIKSSSQSLSYEILNLSIRNETITYYKLNPLNIQQTNSPCPNQYDQKITVFQKIKGDRYSIFMQLNSYDYWIFTSGQSIQLLKFNKQTNPALPPSMDLKQILSLQDNINNVFLSTRTNEFFITTKLTTVALFSFKLDESQSRLSKEQYNQNSLLSNALYLNIKEDIMISCNLEKINVYQIIYGSTNLKFLGTLRERNGNLCALSSFKVIKIDDSLHIQQIFQMTFNLNVINVKQNINSSSFIAQISDNANKQFRIYTVKTIQSLVEDKKKQQLIQFKNNGIVYIYDLLKKNIANQVRYWYIYSSIEKVKLFNHVYNNRISYNQLQFNVAKMTESIQLICGIEYKTFKIKLMNIQTFEITYEQEFPQINIPLIDLVNFESPVYFGNSDSFIVPVTINVVIEEVQTPPYQIKKVVYDLCFFKKNPDQISKVRYILVNHILAKDLNVKSYLASQQAEKFIIFDSQIQRYYYIFYIYNTSGIIEFTSVKYQNQGENRLAQINEDKKYIVIFGYEKQFTVDLVTLVSKTYNLDNSVYCPYSTVINQDFTLMYMQNQCSGINQVYSYPSLSIIQNDKKDNTSIFSYVLYPNYIVFVSLADFHQFYDIQNNKFFYVKSIHGDNSNSWIWDQLAVFFNSQAATHYDLQTQQLQFADVYYLNVLLNIYLDGLYLKVIKQIRKILYLINQVKSQTQNSKYFYKFSILSKRFYFKLQANKNMNYQINFYIKDIVTSDSFFLEASRNNFLFRDENIISAKKYNQIIFSVQKDLEQSDYISELRLIVYLAQSYIRIYNDLTKNLIKQIPLPFSILFSDKQSKHNFSTQEIFTRNIFYYEPSNIIVLVYYKTMFCVSASSLEIVYKRKFEVDFESYKSIIVDKELGYLFSTHFYYDIIFDMNTLKEDKPYRDNLEDFYKFIKMPIFENYMQQLFYDEKTKMVIICQMASVRLFSLKDKKYPLSDYTNADINSYYGILFFYNPYHKYVIFTNTYQEKFSIIYLRNFDSLEISTEELNLPQPSKQFSINYRIWFLTDKSNYIFIGSNESSIQIFNQMTHKLVKKIYIQQAFYPYSTVVVDEDKLYIFFIDQDNTIQHISYATDQIIFKYQLNFEDKDQEKVFQKDMIWDSFKEKLIVNTNTTLYVIGISKKLIEFYYYAIDKIVQIQLIPNANAFSVTSFQSCSFFDYDYLISDNTQTFPNQFHPRYFIVNEDTIFHLNDMLSQATLFTNKKIKGTWIRNQQFIGYIRIVENDLQRQLVYAIFDNEIAILDVSSHEINQIDQYFLDQNIILILHEDNNNIFLQSQSQQILILKKKQQYIKKDETIYEAIILSLGIANFVFTFDSRKVILTDQKSDYKITILDFSYIQDKLIGKESTPIMMESRIVDFKMLSETQLVILLQNNLLLYNINEKNIKEKVSLPYRHVNSNIKIDQENKRIFVQNIFTGSLIYDFNINQSGLKRINTFSTDISFDQYFIYSITSHSANIYFRKDLKFLTNFRHFNNTLTLKKISYLGIGYFFMVEFITKLTIYEFSPFNSQPLEKDSININQYNIFKYRFQMLKFNRNSNLYQFEANFITIEGLSQYTSQIDMFQQKITSSCLLIFPHSIQDKFDQRNLNQISSFLQQKQIKLDIQLIQIKSGQNLHFSDIEQEKVSQNFGIKIIGQSSNDYLYMNKDSQMSQKTTTYLKLIKMELKQFPDNKDSIALIINKINFPNLQQFSIQDILLNEVQIIVTDINKIKISNLKFNKNQTSITRIEIKYAQTVEIESLTIDSSNFQTQQPLLEFEKIKNVTINNLKIQKGEFQSIRQLFSFISIDYIQIKQIQFTDSKLYDSLILKGQNIRSFNISNLMIEKVNFTYYTNKKLRLLENNKMNVQKIFDFYEVSQIKIENIILDRVNQINLDAFQDNLKYQIQMFSMIYVQQQLIINNLLIQNATDSDQNYLLFSLQGINNTSFQNINIKSQSLIQFLIQDQYQINELYSFSCNYTDIKNFSTISEGVEIKNQLQFIKIQSQQIIIQDFTFNGAQLNEISSQSQSLILLKATSLLLIQNFNSKSIKLMQQNFIQIQESNDIIIKNSTFQKISLSSGSPINILSSNGITLHNNTFLENNSQLGSGGAIFCQASTIKSLTSNIFNSNNASNKSGGAIFCQTSTIKSLKSNIFNSNSAINGSGGAIFLNDCEINEFNSNVFKDNQAFIGGAIRYIIKKPEFLVKNQLIDIKSQNTFFNNKYIAYGKDFASYIFDIKQISKNDDIRQNPIIENVQSGYEAKYPIYIILIDEEMQEANFIDFNDHPNIMQEIKEEFSLYEIFQIESEEIGLQGDLKQSYQQEQFAYVFNVSYSFKPESESQIKIKSVQSLPHFQSNQQIMKQEKLELSIQVKFRECQIGEVFSKSGNYILCFSCEKGFYSIENPYQRKDLTCTKCPVGSIDCKGSQIQLENGYWRSGEYSDIIVYCINKPQNCQFENYQTKKGCVEGYIGPLCEECDVKGEIWGSQYVKTSEFNCQNCGQFNHEINTIILMCILIFITFQLSIKTYKQLNEQKNQILASYLSKMGLVSSSVQRQQNSSAPLIKILLSYFQFMMIVNSLNITIPKYFTAFSLSGGDTSQHTINRLDCFIFKYQASIPNYVIRVIWINLQPLIFLLLIFIINYLIFFKYESQIKKCILQTNMIIIFSYFQPTVTKVLSQSTSCREIGDQKYIISDLNEICLTKNTLYFFLSLIFPLALFWVIVVPLIIFCKLWKNKRDLNRIRVILSYGYLYQPIPSKQEERNCFQNCLFSLKKKYPQLLNQIQIYDINRSSVFILQKRIQKKIREVLIKNAKLNKKFTFKQAQAIQEQSTKEKTDEILSLRESIAESFSPLEQTVQNLLGSRNQDIAQKQTIQSLPISSILEKFNTNKKRSQFTNISTPKNKDEKI